MLQKIFTPKVIGYMIILGVCQLIIFDWAHSSNWFGINDIMFTRFSKLKGGQELYSYGELLSEIDNYFLMLSLLIPAAVYCKGQTFVLLFITLIFDIILAAYSFCFIVNPYHVNWNKVQFVGVSMGIFALNICWIWWPIKKKVKHYHVW